MTSSRMRLFWKEQSGSASVDGIIWIMFFTTLLVFVLDAAIMFMNNTQVRRVTQDGSRMYVRGGFSGEANPEAAMDLWIEAKLAYLSPNVNATSSVDADDRVFTEVVYPASDTDLTGLLDVLTGFNIQVVVVNQKMVF